MSTSSHRRATITSATINKPSYVRYRTIAFGQIGTIRGPVDDDRRWAIPISPVIRPPKPASTISVTYVLFFFSSFFSRRLIATLSSAFPNTASIPIFLFIESKRSYSCLFLLQVSVRNCVIYLLGRDILTRTNRYVFSRVPSWEYTRAPRERRSVDPAGTLDLPGENVKTCLHDNRRQ